MKKDLNNAIDVKYIPVSNQNGSDSSSLLDTKLYTIGQVSKELRIPTYTVRYWTDTYNDYLDIKMCNTHRRYTELDIAKLKIIQRCVNNKMGHQQIIDALQNTEFNEEELIKTLNDKQGELNIQVIASALATELEQKIKISNEILLKEMITQINNQNESLQKMITEQVDMIISDKINSMSKTLQHDLGDITNMNTSINEKIDTMASNISKKNTTDEKESKHIQELLSNIKKQQDNIDETMSDIKKTQEDLKFSSITLEEYQKECNNQSWFSNLFRKHK